MKLGASSALDRLAADRRCLGAVFTSFTFDPAFFEEQLLGAVLRLASDPTEQPERYHEEARRALQETPVACIVDAGMRQPGHRLPYDLLEVAGRTFHPKVSLLLYEDFARLQVGSGNLTRGGYGGNTELFFTRDLAWDAPVDVASLQEVDGFLEKVAALVRAPGTQLALVRQELRRRAGGFEVARGAEPAFRFLHTEEGPLLPRFLELLPERSRISRVGVLAPFLERDDPGAGSAEEVASVLLTLAGLGEGRAEVDLGLLWEDPPDPPTGGQPPTLSEAMGQLWCLHPQGANAPRQYLTPLELTASRLRYRDQAGISRTMPREDAERHRQDGALWPVGAVRAFAPAAIVQSLEGRAAALRLWLHPARRLEDGRPVTRPLHAKLLLVTASRGARAVTYVLLGSPNASRQALLAEGGNVEAAVAFALEGEVELKELAPELVACDPHQLALRERTFPSTGPNFALLVQSAVHDAAARTLTVTWAAGRAPPPEGWELRYLDRGLASGVALPEQPTVCGDFTLLPQSCELTLRVGEADFAIPITVSDLAALPPSAALADLGLSELLALLGRRIGRERLGQLRAQRGRTGTEPVLAAIFGDGFGPTDVFRAWWGVQDELREPWLSPVAFRLRLEGVLGVKPTWDKLRQAAEAGTLSRDEAWFYGAELRRTLAEVEPDLPTEAAEKREILRDFLAALGRELAPLAPIAESAWVRQLRRFYQEET